MTNNPIRGGSFDARTSSERLQYILDGTNVVAAAGGVPAPALLRFVLLGLEIGRRDQQTAAALADEIRELYARGGRGGRGEIGRATDAQADHVMGLAGPRRA